MPDILTGLGLECHQRRAEQVVALTHRPVIIRSAIADRKVDKAELGIERWRVPDRGATAHRMVGARRPGVAPDLARTRQRVPPPQDRTGLCVERGEPAAHAELAASDAAIDDAVIVERRAGDAVAVLPLFDRRLPSELAGFMSIATTLASSWPKNSRPSPMARPRLTQPQHTVEIFWSIPDQYSHRIAPVLASRAKTSSLPVMT